ncbi:hypothetical protein Scep_017867 [Stephania cephalantha]|uniref:SOUL heme-binding protein n=1 Tax=Stephania cephalantha TaxID=152367 RepID=A0AAP0IQ84_9MAGN
MESKMENSKPLLISLCVICAIVGSSGTESPQFTVVHSESDFEIRLYRESVWMSAYVPEISFEKATREGFHRLYQYVRGANNGSSELEMTAPVLTSTIPVATSVGHYVRFYLPTECQEAPPHPLPELNLQFDKWKRHCVAVRKFSGFATDNNIDQQVEDLLTSVARSQTGNSIVLEDKHGYAIAQYNASFHLSGRLNEVWMGVLSGKGLFQYIEGANLNDSRVSMTLPVLTSIAPEAGPLHSSAYIVQFYLPVKFQGSPPVPLPELNLQPHAWASHCIAVRKFSGFARDSNVVAEAEKLAVSLSRSPWANSTSPDSKYAYSIAQYNSPFRFIGRVNEVWVDIDGLKIAGCSSDDLATF